MFFLLSVPMLILLARLSYGSEQEPRCYSKFDWQEKLLEKTIKTELQMQEYVREMDKAMENIRVHKDEFETMKTRIDKTVEDFKTYVETQIQLLLGNVTASLGEFETTKTSIDQTVKDLKSNVEMEMKQLEENVAKSQEDMPSPTIAFNANNAADRSPALGQVIIFQTVLQNVGDAYDSTSGIFTAPVNGTYMFSVQVCTEHAKEGRFRLVVDKADNFILAIRHYNGDASYTSTSDSVAVYITKGQKAWVQSSVNAGSTNTLYDNGVYCWNHFSGALVHY